MPETTLPFLAAELRKCIFSAHQRAGGGHLGSALSVVEILAVLFGRFFRWGEDQRGRRVKDCFVLSKGHAALGYYCLLNLLGRLDRNTLDTFGANGTALEPHPNELLLRDVHATTGSLGQGLSIGVGLALSGRLLGDDGRTYVLVGDGEANEGQIWEAARCAGFLRLDNLLVILDDNGMQQDGRTQDIMPVADLAAAWAGMGWVCAGADGHDCQELDRALAGLLAAPATGPRLLVARTVKAYGVSFLEGRAESHYPPPLSPEDMMLVGYSLERVRPHGGV